MRALVYSKPFCPYCVLAKSHLTKKGIEYKEVECTSTEDKERMIEWVKENFDVDAKTFPQIAFYEPLDLGYYEYVGGYDQLVKRLP